MPDEKRALKVFLCHAHSDKDAVKALYARLKREGVDVWLDKEKLLPGADWEYEIRKAVREADVVVVCLSNQFNQAGFRQKEVRIALDAAMEKLEGEIFIIPARLEECDNLDSLSKWHWVDLFESNGFQRLILALRIRADKIGAALRQRGRATISRPKINPVQDATKKAENEPAEKIIDGKELAKNALQVAGAWGVLQQTSKEKAEEHRLTKEESDREAAEKAALEKTEEDAAAKARLEAEELERQRLAREKAERRKTPRKPNTAIIVGSIGLVGIIFVAIIASLWGDLFPSAPVPQVTVTSKVTVTFAPTETKQPTPTKTPTKAFTPTATALSDEIIDNGVPMLLVPAGEFTMGSENGADDEKPVHMVYLDAFYMDKYEVTNALYKVCEEAGGCTPPHQTKSSTRSSYYGNSEFNDYPVIYVDWNQAKAYCEWRGLSTGSGYTHLPTEAQWEKAARGTDKRTFPWGEGIDCYKANYCKGDTAPVGSYESGQSPYGIYDLTGNVWEWTADWYSETYYQSLPSKNPLGPDAGQYRVLRGGSWDGCGWGYGTRSANRCDYTPAIYAFSLGFRCARSLP